MTLVSQKGALITEKNEGRQSEYEESENKDNVTIREQTHPEGIIRELEAHTCTMANTTSSTVETGEKTPALPQFISPPTFNPCTDSAQSFIETYD